MPRLSLTTLPLTEKHGPEVSLCDPAIPPGPVLQAPEAMSSAAPISSSPRSPSVTCSSFPDTATASTIPGLHTPSVTSGNPALFNMFR